MDKRNFVLQSVASAVAMTKLAAAIKQADGFEFISDVPVPGGHFASGKLEHDYQMKNPVTTTMHPAVFGGAAIGALAAHIAHNNAVANHAAGPAVHLMEAFHSNPFAGAIAGGAAGLVAEGLHRMHYLQQAKSQMERGVNPLDPRYQV